MKEKRNGIANVICFIFVFVFTFAFSSLSFADEVDSLEVANPSKGITLIKDTNGKVNGINLNGNSVVIKDGSTIGEVNFFIDSNRNGKVDSGESAVALPDITGETTNTSKDVVLNDSVTIYGLYEAEYDGDLSITIEATSKINCLKGMYKSHLKGSATIDIKNGVIHEFKGIEYGTCDGDYTLTSYNGSFTYIYGTYGSSYGNTPTRSEIGGDVNINISECKNISGSVYIYGLYSTDVKGKLNLYVDDAVRENNGTVYIYGTYDTTVDKDFDAKYQLVKTGTVYGAFSTSFAGNVNIDIGKKEGIADAGCLTGSIFGLYSSAANNRIAKKVEVNIHDLYTAEGNNYGEIRAIYASGPNTNLTSSDSVTVTVKNIKDFSYVHGDEYVSAAGDVKTTLENIISKSEVKGSHYATCAGDIEVSLKDITCNSSVFGVYAPTSGDNIKAKLDNVKASWISGVYSDSLAGGCKNDLEVTLTDCANSSDSTSTFYAAYGITCGGNAILKSVGSKAAYIYLMNGINVSGDITAISKNDEIDETKKGSLYGAYGSTSGGAATITIEGAKIYNLTANGINAKEGSETIIKDSQIYGSSIYSSSTTKVGDTEDVYVSKVRFSNVTINAAENDETTNIINYVDAGSAADVVFDDDCVLPEKVEFKIARMIGNGYSSIKYKNSLHVAGNYVFTNAKLKDIDNVYAKAGVLTVGEDVKIKNLKFVAKSDYRDYANTLYIPKGKSLEVTNDYSAYDIDIILEGSLKAEANELASGETSTVKWYLNGGNSTAIRTEDYKYYPVNVKMTEYAGTNYVTGVQKFEFMKDIYWAKLGDKINVHATIVKGFHFGVGTVKGESEETATELKYSESGFTRIYTFTMLDEKTYVSIACEGDDVEIEKSVDDPIAKTNVLYTIENPLYDFNSLVFIGDIEEGTIKSEVAAGSLLPMGLYIKDNKIIGKVTSENEGVDVNFVITARNGAKDIITLKIVVEKSEEIEEPEEVINPEETKDDKKQENKETKKSASNKTSKSANTVKYGPAKGTKIADKKLVYKVTKVGSKGGKIVGEVEVVGIKNKKSKSVKIAASVTIDGVKYNVTSIGKKAFKGCKKLKKVTIGSNVKTILANAFAKCKKLKKVTIKSKKLKKVAKGSFKGVKKSCKIKVPKAKKKAYKKMFKKAKCKVKVK